MARDKTITRSDVLSRLTENELAFKEMVLQEGVSIVVTQRGGRILGPFVTQRDESVFWLNEAFASPDTFVAFLKSRNWNLGGERVWIAPELAYNVRDRTQFWNTYDLPSQVDPGNYGLTQTSQGVVHLHQDMRLQTYLPPNKQKELSVERSLRLAANPLRHLSVYEDIMKDVIFAGYEHVITLKELKADGVLSESWDLVQVRPGGNVIIPSFFGLESTDYYEPIDSNLHHVFPNHVQLSITGERRYKVGYKSTTLLGRFGYLNVLDRSRSYLIIRSFFNNPSSLYAEEPADLPGRRGHSVHVYNDDTSFGCFGELECSGQTIGGETGKSIGSEQLLLWLYVGHQKKLARVARFLLGVEL